MPFFHTRAALYALMAVLSVVVLIGHHTVPPLDRDESRFAQASKQMLQTGDYVTVWFQDELRTKKPAGIYWLQSIFANVLGSKEISSYRFVNLIALLSAIFALYHMALQFYEARAAFGAVALFSSGFVVMGEAHLAKTDTVLMALALGQQWALMRFYVAWQAGLSLNRYNWLWFWGLMGLGVLVKGPILPILAGLTVAALSLWHRQVVWLRALRFGSGFLLLLVICLPWTILVTMSTDGEFIAAAIKGDLFSKVATVQESHGAPPGAYTILLGLLIWPASPLLVFAFSNVKKFVSHIETRFLLAWVVPFWLMIELIPTKLPHYPLPLLPGIVLLLIAGVGVPPDPKKVRVRWQYYLEKLFSYLGVGAGLILALAVLWAAFQFGGETSRQAVFFAIFAILMAILSVWYSHLWMQKVLWSHFFNMVGAALLFHFIVFSGVVPALSRIHVSSAIAREIAELPIKPSSIATAGYQEPSLVFLLGKDLLLVDPREAALFLVEAPNGLVIIEQRQHTEFVQTAQKLEIGLAQQARLSGFNISKGQNVIIFLYSVERFDANASKE